MAVGLLVPGAFVVALALGLVIGRGHCWLVAFGGIVAVRLWFGGARAGASRVLREAPA
jgi:hypothetical protein